MSFSHTKKAPALHSTQPSASAQWSCVFDNLSASSVLWQLLDSHPQAGDFAREEGGTFLFVAWQKDLIVVSLLRRATFAWGYREKSNLSKGKGVLIGAASWLGWSRCYCMGTSSLIASL